jgi:ATP-binding protein involved in chromosome partitioning
MNQTNTTGTKNRPSFQSIHPGLSDVRHIIAIASGKGGVGKSTVASNLAVALKATGASVGLMDADIYGPSQPGMLGAGGEQPNVDGQQLVPVTRHGVKFISVGLLLEDDSPVIWRAPIATKMIQQFIGSVAWGKLDYLLIDLPPGTGDVQITLAQQAPLSGAVIVTTPQEVALGVARKGLKMFERVNVPILGVIENMSGFTCAHCGKTTAIFKEGGGKSMAAEFKTPYLGAIPLDPEIVTSGEKGVPVVESASDSASARAFVAVAENMQKELDLRSGATDTEPINVALSPEGNILIEWRDGHTSTHSPYTLRRNCVCAQCVDENTGKKLLDEKRIPLDIKVTSFSPVGRYALAFAFSDKHDTGYYTYERLRDLCECPECRKQRGESDESFSV